MAEQFEQREGEPKVSELIETLRGVLSDDKLEAIGACENINEALE